MVVKVLQWHVCRVVPLECVSSIEAAAASNYSNGVEVRWALRVVTCLSGPVMVAQLGRIVPLAAAAKLP